MAIDLTGWTELPESPQRSGEGLTTEIVRIYSVPNTLNWTAGLPARAESSSDGYFKRYSSRHGPGYTIISLYWASSLTNAGSIHTSRADNTVESDLTVDLVDKPLESHPSYLVCWNYDLWEYVAEGASPSGTPPGWWATDATQDITHSDGVSYLWSNSRPAKDKDGAWYPVGAKTKPGVESYLVVQPVVTARKYCKTKATALAYLLTAVAEVAPSSGFGWGETAANWLAYPIGVQNDGEFWVACNEYRYADDWDDDLYGST